MRSAAVCILLLATFSILLADAPPSWQPVAPGLDLRSITPANPAASDARITVLRIDPGLWELTFSGISQTGETRGHTAREWCEQQKCSAAINAGMFDTDQKTHLGYLRFHEHLNNSHWNNYQSIAAFDPKKSNGVAPFHIFDLDAPGVSSEAILADYSSAVQNLRLIKRPGVNKWPDQNRKWSEAALGEDQAGNILFIFSRSPFSMHDLNQELLSAGIGLVAAQHLEGGPEAQLYVHSGKTELEMFGSYETDFREDDKNSIPWPIPNILAIRPRSH